MRYGLLVLFLVAVHPAIGAHAPFILNMRQSEKSLAAAILVADNDEVRRQSKVIAAFPGALRVEGAAFECIAAADALLDVANSLDPMPLDDRRMITLQRVIAAWVSSMNACEERFGIRPERFLKWRR